MKGKYGYTLEGILEMRVKIDKIYEYIKMVQKVKKLITNSSETNEITFSDGSPMNQYWNRYYEKIYNAVLKLKDNIYFSDAYEIITKAYEDKMMKAKEKRIKKIKAKCVEVNIDYEKYKGVLEHITLNEFVAKIEYLKSNSIPIVVNGGCMKYLV